MPWFNGEAVTEAKTHNFFFFFFKIVIYKNIAYEGYNFTPVHHSLCCSCSSSFQVNNMDWLLLLCPFIFRCWWNRDTEPSGCLVLAVPCLCDCGPKTNVAFFLLGGIEGVLGCYRRSSSFYNCFSTEHEHWLVNPYSQTNRITLCTPQICLDPTPRGGEMLGEDKQRA